MKKIQFFQVMMFAAAIVLAACTNPTEEMTVGAAPEPAEVTLSFLPYDMKAMTRAATSISTVVTRLDVWIYEGGSEAVAVHQSKDDADFGTVSVTLDKTKTYTLYAIGHRATGQATLANGVIAFPDEKVTHAMYYTAEFSPADATSLPCLMERIVGKFTLTTTDAVPDEVAKMTFAISSSPTRWNVDGYGVSPQERTTSFSSFNRNQQDGTASFSVFAIADGEDPVAHTITVTAYDASDQPLQSRTFADVPIRNGYVTTYQGTFFIDSPMTASFTVADWQEYDAVTF